MILHLAIICLLGAPTIHDLIDAGKWDDAEDQLSSVTEEIRPRFEGLIAQGRGQSGKAAEAFERALLATPNVPQLHLHAAHAYFKLQRFEEVLRHARAASSLRDDSVAQPLLEARALEALKRDSEAYSVLNRACDAYEDQFRPCLELAALVGRKNLVSEVRRAAQRTLSRSPDRDASIALFHLLYGDAGALALLEELAAKHPQDPKFLALLAHVYAGERRWFSAARLFEESTRLGGDYAFEAADQYRMAGRHREALRMNGQAPPSDAQLTQRVSILFEQRQYARIVAMNPRLDAAASRYRVAYAHYAVGDHNGARRHAQGLLETNYQTEASALLKAIGRDSAQ